MPLLYCQAVKVGLNIMRNKSLDAGKAMAAFGVVFIHVSFPGQTGQIIKALARSAVPFFFMVSGYFCYYNRRNTFNRRFLPAVSLSLDCKNEQNRVKWAGVNGLGLSTAKGMTEFWM